MTLYLLNLADLLFTLHALRHGAVELNPLMQNVPLQIFYKVFVIGMLCWWLSKREEPIAKIGMQNLTAAYVALNLWHITNLILAWR